MALTGRIFKSLCFCWFIAVLVTSEKPPSKAHPSTDDQDIALGLQALENIGCKVPITNDVKYISFGQDTSIWEFPWMALLVYSDGLEKSTRCGGTLITSRYVLTAAHCIRHAFYSLVSVRLGEYDVAENPDCTGSGWKRVCQDLQEIDIEEAIYHKDYNIHKGFNDIGLIRLIADADFTINVKPIRLPLTSSNDLYLEKMTIAGWGLLETGLRARILQSGKVPITDNRDCQEAYPATRVTRQHICVKSENRTYSCIGDSGGPLFDITSCTNNPSNFEPVQFGIISYGASECGSVHPDVFTRVQSHIIWIAANIRP